MLSNGLILQQTSLFAMLRFLGRGSPAVTSLLWCNRIERGSVAHPQAAKSKELCVFFSQAFWLHVKPDLLPF